MCEIVTEAAKYVVCLDRTEMVRLTKKAFLHSPPPFPLLHADST